MRFYLEKLVVKTNINLLFQYNRRKIVLNTTELFIKVHGTIFPLLSHLAE